MQRNDIVNKVLSCVKNQNYWRQIQTINLIASENAISKAAASVSYSDFAHRYAEGLVFHREYQGQKYQDEIEQITVNSVKNLFSCKYADVRATTGTTANIGFTLSRIPC